MPSALKAQTHSHAVVASPALDAPPETVRQETAMSATCPRCYGTGMEVISGKGARRCECRKQDDRAKLLEASHIPCRYQGCSLSNYRPAQGNGSHLQAFNYAFKLVDEYPAEETLKIALACACGVAFTRCAAPSLWKEKISDGSSIFRVEKKFKNITAEA